MRTFFILLHKELKSIFLSPLAYVVMAFLMIVNGVPFILSLVAMQAGQRQHSLVYLTFNSGWFWMSFLVLFPLITMRLFAEEQKLGTIETLLTAPVRTVEVVAAKFTATLVFYIFLWIPSLANFFVFESIAEEAAAYNVGSFYGSYLMLLLLGIHGIALGCLASSLTSNQIIAAVIAFSLVLLHFFLGFLHLFSTRLPAQVMERLTYTSSYEHMRSFSDGLIDSRPIVYYLTSALFVLILTHRVLDYRKWRV
ncbi:MAG: ABC transporter permease [Verrucomicrobiales bacterium]